jgi:hypothetical protein
MMVNAGFPLPCVGHTPPVDGEEVGYGEGALIYVDHAILLGRRHAAAADEVRLALDSRRSG